MSTRMPDAPASMGVLVDCQRAGRGAPRVQVEGGAGGEDMDLETEQADRLILVGAVHRGELQLAGIDHGDRAAALDFQRVVRTDERGGVLVQADADRE